MAPGFVEKGPVRGLVVVKRLRCHLRLLWPQPRSVVGTLVPTPCLPVEASVHSGVKVHLHGQT